MDVTVLVVKATLMSYSRFTVEDFVLDQHFRQWVLAPDAESNLFWQNWLRRYPEKKALLKEARTIILKLPRINYGWNSELEEHLWQSIVRDMPGSGPAGEMTPARVVPLHAVAVLTSSVQQPRSMYGRWSHHGVGRVAAGLILLLSFGIAGYLGSHEPKAEPSVVYLTKKAPWGTKGNIILPDGSRILLNAGSTIRYPERFSSQERLIEIQGEVFLEVAKDQQRPFRVRSGTVVTEALGTAFNVWHEQQQVVISLVEGQVQLRLDGREEKGEELILWPGEQASLRDETYLLKEAFDIEQVTAWKENILFFTGAGEQEVIQKLERWYGVTIRTQGHAAKPWSFSGKFKDKSLEYVLKSIGYTMEFHFTKKGKEVKIIYP